MSNLVDRRIFLAGLLSSAAPLWAQAPSQSLRPQQRPKPDQLKPPQSAQSLIDAAKLSGTVGFAAIDVKTGRVIDSFNTNDALPPASVSKSITALYALDSLGRNFRFRTRLVAIGPVQNGILKGDLVLHGSGDPTLDTDGLAAMASQLKQAGIKEVTGKLRTYEGSLPYIKEIDKDQLDYAGYNPSISGLNLNYNRVHFEWRRSGGSYNVTMDARSKRYRPDVRTSRMQIVNRRSPLYTYKDARSHDSWTVAQPALGNGGARWLPVRKPATYAAEVFSIFARSQGINLRVGSPVNAAPKGTVLVTRQSDPLTKLLKDMLKFSTNLTAEVIGLTATTRSTGKKPASLKASAQAMTRWASSNLGMKSAKFVDHSGLGSASRISAVAMGQAMQRARASGFSSLLKPIAMRHQNGAVNKGHPLKVLAKTGTLYFVSSLSGYVTTPQGQEIAFAIFSSNSGLRSKIDRNSDSAPQGSKSWNRRAKRLQQSLIERWGKLARSPS